jgi:hypothetical protein
LPPQAPERKVTLHLDVPWRFNKRFPLIRVLRILTGKELNTYFLNPFGWGVLAFVELMQGFSLSL